MQIALIAAVAIIALLALVALALRRARVKPPLPRTDPYEKPDSELSEIVARRLGKPTDTEDRNGLRSGEGLGGHGEVEAESEPSGAPEAGAGIAPDRLLEPPEWPNDFSTRLAERTRIG